MGDEWHAIHAQDLLQHCSAAVRSTTNLIINNMMNITFELRAAYCLAGVEIPIILSQENKEENGEKYDERCKIFNTKFRFMPAAIVLCTTAEQVSVAVKFTSKLALPLRVRSGGHDHEGECSGTDTILLDLSKMNMVTIDGKDKKAEADSKPRLVLIQPGTPFKKLTTELAEKDFMIPHGTCGTVCIVGYTMGGGWGPWTRKYGMCCERVVGATVMLGDGSIRKLRMSKSSEEELEVEFSPNIPPGSSLSSVHYSLRSATLPCASPF